MKLISFDELVSIAKQPEVFYKKNIQVELPWETISNQGEPGDIFSGIAIEDFMHSAVLAHKLNCPIKMLAV